MICSRNFGNKKIWSLITALVMGFSNPILALPNVIIILTDDQGYNDIGVFGSPLIKTPRLDKLANEGVRFTDFYVAQNVCSASRAALLTGSHHLRVGISGVLSPNGSIGLNPNEVTIADLLKRKGYATACVGKWHLGDATKFLPTRQGFDSYFGIPYSNDMTYNKTNAVLDPSVKFGPDWTADKIASTDVAAFPRALVPLIRNEKVIEFPVDQSTLTQRYTDEAIGFIAKSTKEARPFFLYLAHTMPHTPLNPGPAFKGRNVARGYYGDAIEEIDYNVGRIVDTLKSLGIDKNTLLIYTSDNGPWLAKGKEAGSAYPLRDGKFTDWEGGQRVPCIMNWPGELKPLVQKEMATTMDIFPTLAKLVGLPLPTNEKVNGNNIVLDGFDIMPLMKGEVGAKRTAPFFYDLAAVRLGNWKLGNDSLFNLAMDIGESKDSSAFYPAKKKELQDLLNAFNKNLVKRGAGNLSTVDPKEGCTNVDAPNYDPQAGRDNGTCSPVTTLEAKVSPSQSYRIIQGIHGLEEIHLDQEGRVEIFDLSGKREWNDDNRLGNVHSLAGIQLKKGFHWLRIRSTLGASIRAVFVP